MHDHDRARDLGTSPLAQLDVTIAAEDAAQRTPPHGDALLERRLDTTALHRLPSGDYEGLHRLPRA